MTHKSLGGLNIKILAVESLSWRYKSQCTSLSFSSPRISLHSLVLDFFPVFSANNDRSGISQILSLRLTFLPLFPMHCGSRGFTKSTEIIQDKLYLKSADYHFCIIIYNLSFPFPCKRRYAQITCINFCTSWGRMTLFSLQSDSITCQVTYMITQKNPWKKWIEYLVLTESRQIIVLSWKYIERLSETPGLPKNMLVCAPLPLDMTSGSIYYHGLSHLYKVLSQETFWNCLTWAPPWANSHQGWGSYRGTGRASFLMLLKYLVVHAVQQTLTQ